MVVELMTVELFVNLVQITIIVTATVAMYISETINTMRAPTVAQQLTNKERGNMKTYKTRLEARRDFPGEAMPSGNYLYQGKWYHIIKVEDGYQFAVREDFDPKTFGTFRI